MAVSEGRPVVHPEPDPTVVAAALDAVRWQVANVEQAFAKLIAAGVTVAERIAATFPMCVRCWQRPADRRRLDPRLCGACNTTRAAQAAAGLVAAVALLAAVAVWIQTP